MTIVVDTPLARLGAAIHRGKRLALCPVCHQLAPEREGRYGPVLVDHYAERAKDAYYGKLSYYCQGSGDSGSRGSIISIDWEGVDMDAEEIREATRALARSISERFPQALVRCRTFGTSAA